jgi:hypothetical protein
VGKRFLSEGRALQSSLLRSVKPSTNSIPPYQGQQGQAQAQAQQRINGTQVPTKNKIYEHPVAFGSNKAASVSQDPAPSYEEESSHYEPDRSSFVQFSPIIKGRTSSSSSLSPSPSRLSSLIEMPLSDRRGRRGVQCGQQYDQQRARRC